MTVLRVTRRMVRRAGSTTLNYQLGKPHDITLQELRIESFFPADTAAARRLASG